MEAVLDLFTVFVGILVFSGTIIMALNIRMNKRLKQEMDEHRQVGETLREAQRRQNAILDNIPDIAWLKDRAGRYVAVNKPFGRVFKVEPDDIIGKTDLDFMEKREATGRSAEDLEVMSKGKGARVEMCAMNYKGETIWVETYRTPIFNEEGEVTGVTGIAREITVRKLAEQEKERLEAQLVQARKIEAIGTLAGGIAHNFNNLLMTIQGNTSLMLLNIDSTHEHCERLKNIEKVIQNGAKLTGQLLGYAREGKFEVRTISLNRLVEETSETFAITKKDIRVHRGLSTDLYGINADQGQIDQVLLNLYVNAADAMPRGGDLYLKTFNVTHKELEGKAYMVKPGNYALLTVTDTGVGMDKKTMERVFDPFFTTKGLSKGTGLGLASVYGIIKTHEGYIDVHSKEGEGTTFKIYLPASKKEVITKQQLPEEISPGKETILFVDDEDMVTDVGNEMLKVLGHNTLIAKSGKEAIEALKKDKGNIDLVILDMIMPDMSGGETYDRIKEIDPDIKVLLSSGYSIDGQADEIIDRGCDAFIQKPFKIKELSMRIREVMDK